MEQSNTEKKDDNAKPSKGGRRTSLNYRKRYRLHDLCYSRKVKEIKELLQQNDAKAIAMLNEKAGVLGYTPLHEAASSGTADVLELLLIYGGNPNATSGGDYTPLHIAATVGDCECIKVLLEHGADIKQEDEYHKTPYVKAKLSGRTRAARQLLSAEIIAAAAADDPNLGKKIANLKPGKEIEENCFDRALEKAVEASRQRATGFLCLQGAKNELACLQKALRRTACYQAAVMLLLCHAARTDDIEMIKYIITGFADRKRFLSDEGHRIGKLEGHRFPQMPSAVNDAPLKRNYLPADWDKTIPFHVLEGLRNEATNIEMAFPICVAVNEKKFEAAKLFLLETCTTKGHKYVDWHGLALNVLLADWINKIDGCEKLILSHNAITKLPKCVVNLRNLNRLDLSDNQLFKISKEIFEMPSLKNLNLAGNKLESLPQVEDWSQSMSILNLKGNYLQTLPDTIKESLLVDLNIAGNRFLQFPLCLCEILTLKTLDISKNRYITVLPPELGKLRKLQSLNLADMDQITDPPPAMRKPTSVLIRHLEATLRGSEAYYNMKLMFVGLANKGKTTLLHRLQGDFQFNADQSTVGVEIREITIRKGQTYTFKCWDFAGQEEYYATHQCFLSQRSLYLLVWDLRDREQGIQQLKPWLDNLGTRVPNSTVLIVGTHLDKISEEERKDGFEQQMTKLIWELVHSRDIYRKVRVPNSGYIAVGKDSHERIEHLRNVIYNTAEGMTVDGKLKGGKIMGDRVPSSYLNLARAIAEKLKTLYSERKIPILKKEEYANLVFQNSKKTCKDIFPDDMELATTFLHNIGVILHYDDPNQNLRDLYFIDPSWLCQLMGQVVTVKEVHNFFVHGILDVRNLSQILKASNAKFPVEFYPQYLRLLYRFQIACKVDDNRILIPSVLPVEPPDDFNDVINEEIMLDRIYSLSCIPPGFWPRFIGRLLLYMPDVLGSSDRKETDCHTSPSIKTSSEKSSNGDPGMSKVVMDNTNFEASGSFTLPITQPISVRKSDPEETPHVERGREQSVEKQLSIVLNSCVLPFEQDMSQTPTSRDNTPSSEFYRALQESPCGSNKTLDSSRGSEDSSLGRNASSHESTEDRENGIDRCRLYNESTPIKNNQNCAEKRIIGERSNISVEISPRRDEISACSDIKQNSHSIMSTEELVLDTKYDICLHQSEVASVTDVDVEYHGIPSDLNHDSNIVINSIDSLTIEDNSLSASVTSEDLPKFFYRKEVVDEPEGPISQSLQDSPVASGLTIQEDVSVNNAEPNNDYFVPVDPELADNTTMISIPERSTELFDGRSLSGSPEMDTSIALDEGSSLSFEDTTDISSLLDRGILKCWRTGMLFKHRTLTFSISLGEKDEGREIINIKVSRTSLGFCVLGRIIDHFRTLIKEWYPGCTGDDGQQPFILSFIPCPLCIDFNFKDVFRFDIRHCLSTFLANDYVLCPNNHVPRVIKLRDICPEIAFRDLDSSFMLSSSALYFSESEDNVIGAGKFGTVYRGICKSSPAAIKVYNFKVDKDDMSLALDKFYEVRQEVTVLSRLKKHPFIIGFLGVCVRPKLCAVMELAGRGTLKDPLHKRPTLIPRTVVYRISHQLISALAYLHSLNMIHRDLKSDNILLFSLDPEAEINIKLADFGTTDFISSTGLKYTVGTVGYHAPEMLEYSRTDEYTAKVDVYSFAIVLSELITKRRPFFDVDNELTVDAMVKEGKRPKFGDIDTSMFGFLTLTELMVKAWDGDPMKRPGSAQVKEQLECPTFSLLVGKYQLNQADSPRSICTIPQLAEVWIACNCGGEGPFIIVLDMNTGKLKTKFRPSYGKSKTVNLTIVNMYFLGGVAVGVVLRNVRDFVFILNGELKKAVEVHAFDDNFILALELSEEYAFVGFHNGKLIRMNRKEFIKGKVKDLITISTTKQNCPVNALAAIGQDLYVGKDDSILVYPIKAVPNSPGNPQWTLYQEGRDHVQEILNAERFALVFIIYNRSSKITCIRSSDKAIIGEVDCSPIVKQDLSSSNDTDERVTCICLAQDTLWVGTGSGHVLLFHCHYEALPTFGLSLRPYLLETRLIASFSKSIAGGIITDVVLTSGKDVNPLALSSRDDLLCPLTSSFPIDTSDYKRLGQRRQTSGPSSPIDFQGMERSQDGESPTSPVQPAFARAGKVLLFFEAVPAKILKKFPAFTAKSI